MRSRSTDVLSHCRAEFTADWKGEGFGIGNVGHPAGALKSVVSTVSGVYFSFLVTCHCQSSWDRSSCPPPLHRATCQESCRGRKSWAEIQPGLICRDTPKPSAQFAGAHCAQKFTSVSNSERNGKKKS